MKTWTVIGYYRDNLQPWATSVEADTYEAAQEAGREDMAQGLVDDRAASGGWEDHELADELISAREEVIVTGVVEGQHAVYGGDNEHGIY